MSQWGVHKHTSDVLHVSSNKSAIIIVFLRVVSKYVQLTVNTFRSGHKLQLISAGPNYKLIRAKSGYLVCE